MATLAPVTAQGRTFLGHPAGLFVLFFAEMWERFSYYGMRALLMFYLIQHWTFAKGEASLIYGAYTSLVYITPVIGGYLADRWLGQRKAVTYGAVLLAVGHCLMVVEGTGGQGDPTINVFWLALAFIITGSGFLKANISVIVGQLYPLTDPRRDPAYTIFYVGINTGAFLGAIVAGGLGQTWGWSWGFGAAGLGMLLGLATFVLFRPALLGRGEPRDPAALRRRTAGLTLEAWLYLSGLLAVTAVWWVIRHQALVGTLLGLAGAALVGWVVYTAVLKLPREERDRIFALLFLIVCSILFWALFEQAGNSLNLYTDEHVNRHMLGFDVPASIFQSVNSLYIMAFGPVIAGIWTWLGKWGREPSAPAKFGIGMLQIGFSFLVLVWGARGAGVGQLTPVLFVFLIYLFQTTGELCLSPVGLSAINRLSPLHLASLMMGTWYFATAAGNFAAGLISVATGGGDGVAGAGQARVLAVYQTVGCWGMGAGVAILLVAPWVKRLMHLETLVDAADHAMAGQSELAEPQAAGFRTSAATL